ncbi:MAG: D-amino acid dehydrogenase [Gammaproteobacteria bacterium]|nr:D-amino acid dehydrogenase [Gammaproteobacteria bacterium]
MHCIVVGAGLLGLTTAACLQRAGARVTVLERGHGPALETSFANGGMLHASQASPWNEPGVLGQALRMIGREDSALLIRPRALPHMLRWSWDFFRHSAPRRFEQNMARNARLASYSLRMLDELFGDLAPEFERADRGTLKIYRTAQELDQALAAAERCRAWDVDFQVLDGAGITALEPALGTVHGALSGGIHFPDDVSGDAHQFCRALATRLEAGGADFRYEAHAECLVLEAGRFDAVVVDGEPLRADACVVAAGSYSTALLAPLGLRLPVQPVKGYSLTIPLLGWPCAPRVPVIDEHFHAAVCPLGDRLRVAGTAEFTGFDATLTPSRIANLYRLVEQVYPDGTACIDRRQVVEWCGFRPMSPDGVGLMGPSAVPGLFLNTGHGHLGWTMAPGAGKLVADQVLGVAAGIAREDYLPARFGC